MFDDGWIQTMGLYKILCETLQSGNFWNALWGFSRTFLGWTHVFEGWQNVTWRRWLMTSCTLEQNACSSLYLTSKALFIENLSQWIMTFILTFCGAWEKMCSEKLDLWKQQTGLHHENAPAHIKVTKVSYKEPSLLSGSSFLWLCFVCQNKIEDESPPLWLIEAQKKGRHCLMASRKKGVLSMLLKGLVVIIKKVKLIYFFS